MSNLPRYDSGMKSENFLVGVGTGCPKQRRTESGRDVPTPARGSVIRSASPRSGSVGAFCDYAWDHIAPIHRGTVAGINKN